MNYNRLKIRSTRWPNGYLKADFYISTTLAAKLIEIIAANQRTPHVVKELPPQPRDAKGHFLKSPAPPQKDAE